MKKKKTRTVDMTHRDILFVSLRIFARVGYHASMTCVDVASYFSAGDTISGWSRTGECPVQFEESVRWINDQFLRMVGLPLGVYAISAMPFLEELGLSSVCRSREIDIGFYGEKREIGRAHV